MKVFKGLQFLNTSENNFVNINSGIMKNRIKPLEVPLNTSTQELMNKIFPSVLPSPNLYRLVAKNEALFSELVESKFIGNTGLYDRKRIAPDLREKIVLRVCVISKNDYEFALHEDTISAQMGVTNKQLKDIKNLKYNSELWNEKEAAIFDVITPLLQSEKVEDYLVENLKLHFSESEIIDIIFLVGLYHTVSMMVNIAQLEKDNYKQ